jgi:hypothetical protein
LTALLAAAPHYLLFTGAAAFAANGQPLLLLLPQLL